MIGGIGLSVGVGEAAASSESAEIDIKPGSDPNSINPKSKGVIPVGFKEAGNSNFTSQGDRVLVGDTVEVESGDGTELPEGTYSVPRFAPTQVFNTNPNGNSLTTNEAKSAIRQEKGIAPVSYSIEDVDGDGDYDLVLKFDTQEFFSLVNDPSSVDEGVLVGIMEWDGSGPKRLFDGSDSIRVVGTGGPEHKEKEVPCFAAD